jgi:hypothetical protein
LTILSLLVALEEAVAIMVVAVAQEECAKNQAAALPPEILIRLQ